ncbi:MAG TPA: hypothetical protein VMA54_12105 [Steroidobacteraceae bacterium]|nr:hypothetical protein [Steroidobacteraceae bacterium]
MKFRATPLLATLLGCGLSCLAFAQVVPAVKESGKAVAELAKEGADEVKAAVEKSPAKAIDKSKAQMHGAQARAHAHRAKAAAKATFK